MKVNALVFPQFEIWAADDVFYNNKEEVEESLVYYTEKAFYYDAIVTREVYERSLLKKGRLSSQLQSSLSPLFGGNWGASEQ